MFGAVAAGASGRHPGGFSDIAAAVERLRPDIAHSYTPDSSSASVYDHVYEVYRGLHDTLGATQVEWLHGLKAVRRDARKAPASVG